MVYMECGILLSILAPSRMYCGIYIFKLDIVTKIKKKIYLRIYGTCHIYEHCTYTLPYESSYGVGLLKVSNRTLFT